MGNYYTTELELEPETETEIDVQRGEQYLRSYSVASIRQWRLREKLIRELEKYNSRREKSRTDNTNPEVYLTDEFDRDYPLTNRVAKRYKRKKKINKLPRSKI